MAQAILVNGRFIGRQITGVDRYASEVLRCLGGRVQVIRPSRPLTGFPGHFWEQVVLPFLVQEKGLLWSPANSGPMAISRQVLTVHDISPLEHPEWFTPTYSLWYRWMLPMMSRRVKCILTPSEYVRQKVMQRFDLSAEQVSTVMEGVNLEMFRPQPADSIRARYAIPGRYILFLGSLQPRKNITLLLEAWSRLQPDFPDVWLVAAGTTGHVFQRLELPAGLQRVIFPGYVPDADLPELYSGAEAFVLPSLEEGFGLTVLEAMACGTPVIISKAGALPEVAGEAGLQVDPFSAEELSASLRWLLSDSDLRDDLKQRGLERARRFPWERSAEQIWEVLIRHA